MVRICFFWNISVERFERPRRSEPEQHYISMDEFTVSLSKLEYCTEAAPLKTLYSMAGTALGNVYLQKFIQVAQPLPAATT